MTRLQLYVLGSVALANVVLIRAYYERPNFYSAAVYISQSTGSLMFLINLALIISASIGYGLQRLFYGPLRAIETEQLYDKAWFAVSETLLAMTIFRDDIGIWFFAMFLCLLAGKVWQWIGEGRVELLEQQPPANPRLFHTRLLSSLLISVAFDIFMMNYCIGSILNEARPGVMVMFGFEYILLAIASISSLLRYTLSLVELVIIHRQEKERAEARRIAREQAQPRANTAEGEAEAIPDEVEDLDEPDVPGWEEKGRWVFYLDLTTDFIKSIVYLGFFVILMAFYGIPIHIVRDLFMTVRSFYKRINDFIKYRNATRDMNERYPDATAEELERENTCIVCREEMRAWVPPGNVPAGHRVDERMRPKKLPCGHILHFSCLRSWLERQQVCPTCRRSVLEEAPQPSAPNNQAHAGQQNQQNAGGPPPLFGPFGGNIGNPQQQPANQHGQHGQPGQQGQVNRQPNGPVGNVRVFNLGPIRIALGNMRIPPPQQPQDNANNAGINNHIIANLAQQLAQHPNQVGNLNQPQNQAGRQVYHDRGINMSPLPVPHPADIQSDILRLQQNIVESLRQLNSQQHQLDYVHALLGELNRIQQAAGVTTANGQGLPSTAPLNPPYVAPVTRQAYSANGAVLRQGDAGLPEGVVLPEGWTLRPLALSTSPVTNTDPQAEFPSASGLPSEPGPSNLARLQAEQREADLQREAQSREDSSRFESARLRREEYERRERVRLRELLSTMRIANVGPQSPSFPRPQPQARSIHGPQPQPFLRTQPRTRAAWPSQLPDPILEGGRLIVEQQREHAQRQREADRQQEQQSREDTRSFEAARLTREEEERHENVHLRELASPVTIAGPQTESSPHPQSLGRPSEPSPLDPRLELGRLAAERRQREADRQQEEQIREDTGSFEAARVTREEDERHENVHLRERAEREESKDRPSNGVAEDGSGDSAGDLTPDSTVAESSTVQGVRRNATVEDSAEIEGTD